MTNPLRISIIRSRMQRLGALSLVLLALPWASFADGLFGIGSFAQDAVMGLLGWIAGFAASATSLLVALTAQFASVMLNPRGFFGEGFLSANIVQLGWGFTLSIANALFIFALLVIGFATIFRVGGYTMKDILWKLIVAALLVNFSLVIAGVFLDASNVLAEYFIHGVGDKNFGGVMVSRLGIDPVGLPDPNAPAPDIGSDNTWAAVQALIAQTIFNLIAAFILFLIGLMFVIRIIWIWVLLILSPLAWIAWILPKTEKHWQKWWTEFFNWAFFAPTATFFLFLAMGVGKIVNTVTSSGTAINALTPGYVSASGIANFLIITGLMVASLTMAKSSAGIGGEMVSSLAGWGAGMIKGAGMKFSGANAVGRYQKAFAGRFKDREKEKQETANKRVDTLMTGRFGVGRVPGVRNMFGVTEKDLNKIKAKKRERRTDQLEEQFRSGKIDQTHLEMLAGNNDTKMREEAAAAALTLAKLQKPREVEEDVQQVLRKKESSIIDPSTKKPVMVDESIEEYEAREGEKWTGGKVKRRKTVSGIDIKTAGLQEKIRHAQSQHAKELGKKTEEEQLIELAKKIGKQAGEEGGGKPEGKT